MWTENSARPIRKPLLYPLSYEGLVLRSVSLAAAGVLVGLGAGYRRPPAPGWCWGGRSAGWDSVVPYELDHLLVRWAVLPGDLAIRYAAEGALDDGVCAPLVACCAVRVAWVDLG
jgi:hypothetical protein